MSGRYNSNKNYTVGKSGRFALTLVEENYKGESRYKFVGRLRKGNDVTIVNIPVDSNLRVLNWPGKDKNEGKVYSRGFATDIRTSGGGNNRGGNNYPRNNNGGGNSYNS